MSIASIKTWVDDEVLTASDLNSVISNIEDQALPAATQADVNAMTSTGTGLTPSSNLIVLKTATAATSWSSATYSSIPSGVRRITIMFSGISTSGTSNIMVQIGDAGGLETTGYLGAASTLLTASAVVTANFTTGFGVQATTAAGTISHGAMTLTLMNSTAFTWTATSVVGHSNVAAVSTGAGAKSLSAELTQLAITTVGGAETFDAGAINISYER